MNPFPLSGIPLLQLRTCIYLSIESGNVNISAKYALLESKSRRRLAQYKNESTTLVNVVTTLVNVVTPISAHF